jgi:hypothetical protein
MDRYLNIKWTQGSNSSIQYPDISSKPFGHVGVNCRLILEAVIHDAATRDGK